jgi:hypothetical protein
VTSTISTRDGDEMFAKFAIRDLSIMAAAILFWWMAADLSSGSGPVGDLTGVIGGALFTLGAYFVHEWGHLLGALATHSVVEPGRSLRSGFLFSFSAEKNSLRQFLVMSFSGFLATGIVAWFAYVVLPDHYLATRVARGAVVFLGSLTVLLEFPLVIWGLLRGGVPPPVAVQPETKIVAEPAT